MELLTKDNLALAWDVLWRVAVIGGVITFTRYFYGGIRGTFALTRARKLKRLQKWRKNLKKLKESDREYYGRLLSGCLWVLALFAVEMMFGGLIIPRPISHPEQALAMVTLLTFLRYVLGIAGFAVALSRLRDYRELQRFDRTIKMLDQAIAKLELKVQPHAQARPPHKEGEAS